MTELEDELVGLKELEYEELRRREEAAKAVLELCPEGSSEREGLLHEWYVLHVARDRRDMARTQAFLTDIFREPCPVCERRRKAAKKKRQRAKSQV